MKNFLSGPILGPQPPAMLLSNIQPHQKVLETNLAEIFIKILTLLITSDLNLHHNRQNPPAGAITTISRIITAAA